MGSDLTYHANAWPGYDNPCVACGAGCRAIDRFCSQCGQPDPLGPREEPSYDDDELARPQTTTRARGRNTEAALALERMLIPGNVFGRRYRIQRFLGAGAMGYVCSAIDNTIDETVALKILSAPVQEDPEGFERFKTELKLARKIRHRNVVQSFDLGFADGYPYISMEYIDADNLMKHLQRRSQFPETVALAIIR